MTFVPKYSAVFELPVINNVLMIIERDMKDALDYFYGSDNLPDFVERSIGTERGLEFPILVIGPRSNLVETADDNARLLEPIKIDIKIGVIDDNPDGAYRKIMKYVRALDAALRTATLADYCAGMTNGSHRPFGFSIDVTHTYGPLGTNKTRTTYFKPANLELTVNLNES